MTHTQLEIIFGQPNPGSIVSGGMQMAPDRTAFVRASAPRRIGGSRFHSHCVDKLELLPRECREVPRTNKRPLITENAEEICAPPEIPHFKLRPEHKGPVQQRHRYFYGTKDSQAKHDPAARREACLYFLSNFYRGAPFKLDGKVYATSEHYYQAQKFEPNLELAERVRRAATAADAKSIATSCKDVPLRLDWDLVRLEVMKRAIHAKFSQNADVCERLLATGTDVLHEDAPVDRVWGVCGADMLGILLVEERTLLRGVPTDQ